MIADEVRTKAVIDLFTGMDLDDFKKYLARLHLPLCGVPRSFQQLTFFEEQMEYDGVDSLFEEAKSIVKQLNDRPESFRSFITWLNNIGLDHDAFQPHTKSSRFEHKLKKWEQDAIRDERDLIQEIKAYNNNISSKEKFSNRQLEKYLRIIKAVSTWIWIELLKTNEWRGAIGFVIPSRKEAFVNYLIYIENICWKSPSLMRALYHVKMTRYLLPLGLSVSLSTSFEDDSVMSFEQLAFLLKIDYTLNDHYQRLLLPFDAENRETIRLAIRNALDSITWCLIDFGISDLKYIEEMPPDLVPLDNAIRDSYPRGRREAFLNRYQDVVKAAKRQEEMDRETPNRVLKIDSTKTFKDILREFNRSGIPNMIDNFGQIITPEFLAVCDYIYVKAYGEKAETFDEETTEDPDSLLIHLERLEEEARDSQYISKKRIGTRKLDNVDLLVAASIIITGSNKQKEIETALNQWPYYIPGQSVDKNVKSVKEMWKGLLQRLRNDGWKIS